MMKCLLGCVRVILTKFSNTNEFQYGKCKFFFLRIVIVELASVTAVIIR
jgi:hypothetical protein